MHWRIVEEMRHIKFALFAAFFVSHTPRDPRTHARVCVYVYKFGNFLCTRSFAFYFKSFSLTLCWLQFIIDFFLTTVRDQCSAPLPFHTHTTYNLLVRHAVRSLCVCVCVKRHLLRVCMSVCACVTSPRKKSINL